MIYLEGFTVCAAGEVKSRAHAFKVYHTGTAFYFACDSRDAMLAWIQLIHRATLLPSLLAPHQPARPPHHPNGGAVRYSISYDLLPFVHKGCSHLHKCVAAPRRGPNASAE